MNKNEFAQKLMEVMNEELLQYEHGNIFIELLKIKGNKNAYTEDGELLFIDNSDDEPFPASQLFAWFNVIMHDEDYFSDGMLTDKMKIWHGKALEAGYITEDTPKYW